MDLAELSTKIEGLEDQAKELVSKLDASPGAVESVQKDLKSIQEELQPLSDERDKRILEHELKDTKAQVTTLTEAFDKMREWSPEGAFSSIETSEKSVYKTGKHSYFADIKAANKGNGKAQERLAQGLGTEDIKAMTEGTDSAGGYLVTPEISRELIELRLAQTPLRSLFSSVSTNSDTLQIASQTGGLTAGWVAELAAKPAADLTFGQISVSVFTAAGLGVVSNQLLQDAGRQQEGPNIGVDTLILRELAKRLAILEEIAFINGSGTGQPQGILGTAGVNAVTYTSASPTVQLLLDAVVDAITGIQSTFFGNPNAIVMHPRTWAYIIKGREATSPSTYLIGAGSTAFGRRGNDPLPGGGALPGGVAGELFGYPVVLSANIPTNQGVGVNESRIIVGDFSEGLILDRQGVTVDESPHVYFTSNQTVFRAETRTGFTAARYPKAFSVIGGTGLVGV